MIFINLFKKSKKKKLLEISKELDSPKILDARDLVKEGNKRQKALDELINYCLSQNELLEIIEKYSIKKDDLRELFRLLSIAGAGQWINGYYILSASFLFPDTLEKLAIFYKNKPTKESILKISSDLIRIFGEK